MKAISLSQPWATLVALSLKVNETRGWRTDYRGPIAIHAARSYDRPICDAPEFAHALRTADLHPNDLPLGAILAVGELYDVRGTGDFRASGTMFERNTIIVPATELAFGDFSAGRWAFRLRDVVKLPRPIGCRGQLNIWDVPDDVAERVERQLAEELAS
ncbi:MAG: 2-oxoglutarate dehydrogenase E1 [Thermoanaerobaculia bacterium]